MNDSNGNLKKWLLPAGIGCLALLCICAGLAVGVFFIQRQSINIFANNFATLEIDIPTLPPVQISTLPPEPTQEPAATTDAPSPETAIPEASGPALTGNQSISDTSLFDDFSSDALGWPVYDDGSTILKYENDAYSIQIVPAEDIDWAYAPTDFSPSYIKFDVWGLPGDQNGTFGVFCQYQDSSNHYFVEFDMQAKMYVTAAYVNDEYITLTQPDSNGQYWLLAPSLHDSPESINTIELTCNLDSISLTINGQLENQITVTEPFTTPGEMALFVYTFPFADENGYKVYFDNITVTE